MTLLNTKPIPQQLLLVGAPSLFVVLWSTGYISARLGLPYAEAGTFLMMRFALAAIVMVALVVVSRAPLPASSSASFASIGANILHGLHHSAQKSTKTGSSLDRSITSRAKVSCVTSIDRDSSVMCFILGQ